MTWSKNLTTYSPRIRALNSYNFKIKHLINYLIKQKREEVVLCQTHQSFCGIQNGDVIILDSVMKALLVKASVIFRWLSE